MSVKRILIISAGFYPVNNPRSFRATELAKEFAKQGNYVVVYTKFNGFDYGDYADRHGIDFKDLGPIILKDIEINGGKIKRFIKRGIRRFLSLLFEYPDIELMFRVFQRLKLEYGYDLLISIAVPHPIHWGVAMARKKNHSIADTWVADCGDPFMGCKTDSFKKLFYFKYFEKWFCRKTDFISIPNQDHQVLYYKEFWNKIKVIPQSFNFKETKISSGPIKHEKPTFAYAGSLLKQKRDPRPLMQYLSSIDKEFKFIMFINDDTLIKPYIDKLKDKLEIHPHIPRDELIYFLSQMDFLINIEFDSSVKTQSPSKMIDYALTQRPIISLNMNNLDKSRLNEFLSGDYTNQHLLGDINRFNIESTTNQFLELIKC